MEKQSWAPVQGSGHPLAELEGKPLAGAAMAVEIGPLNPYGARHFRIRLTHNGSSSPAPVLQGLHRSGPYPSLNWIEIAAIRRSIRLDGAQMDLADDDVETLFKYLCGMIPGGGHLMVQYDTGEGEETRRAIHCGVPQVATPLGFLMYRAGCGIAFKDWYFSEGGSEGPRKLQGYKALDVDHRLTRAKEMAEQLRIFLCLKVPERCRDEWQAARPRAAHVLEALNEKPSGGSPQ